MTKKLKGFRAKKTGNKTHYYFDNNVRGNRIYTPLGNNYFEALKKYAEILKGESCFVKKYTFFLAVERFKKEELPLKSERTIKDYTTYLAPLIDFFGSAPLNQIKPVYIAQYLDHQKNKGRSAVTASNEISLFKTIFNYARGWGYAEINNPCDGIRIKKSPRRTLYITDETMHKMIDAAPPVLVFAIRLAYSTGQRPADIRKVKFIDVYIDNGISYLHFVQNKTKRFNKSNSFKIEGNLKVLIDEIKQYHIDNNITSEYMLYHNGGMISQKSMEYMVSSTREKASITIEQFQFVSLRHKHATDIANKLGIEQARLSLNHSDKKMTEVYIKNEKGMKVDAI
jgi:integrase